MRLIIILIFISNISLGQKDSTKFIKESYNILYGQKYLSHNTFYGAFNDLNKINLGGPITYLGVGVTTRLIVSRGQFDHDGHIYYTHIIPQQIKVNDTITTNLTGFNFAFTYCGFDAFNDKKNFDLLFSLGINTGRLRLYGNSFTNQKNPYFSPKITLTPRFIFGQVCFQLYIDYEFDISRKGWRRINSSNSPKINLDRTSNTGLTILAGFGYVIKERKPEKNKSDTQE